MREFATAFVVICLLSTTMLNMAFRMAPVEMTAFVHDMIAAQ